MLKLVDAFYEPDGKHTIEVYLLKYRMLPEDQFKVFLPGGMTIRDGWLLSQQSMGDPYLVARRTGSTITCVGTIYPGCYTRDAVLEFLLRSPVDSTTSSVLSCPPNPLSGDHQVRFVPTTLPGLQAPAPHQ